MFHVRQFLPGRLLWCFTLLVGLAGVAELARSEIAFAQDENEAVWAADEEIGPATIRESYLHFLIQSLGIKYCLAFFLLYAFLGVWLLWCLPVAFRGYICPTYLTGQLPRLIDAGQSQQARELVVRSRSYLGRILSVGLAHLSCGAASASAIMWRAGELEHTKLRNRLSYLALLALLGPTLGVLGAVDGMLAGFMVISRSSVAPKPSELAEGISTSLVTLMFGLLPAIPTAIAFWFMRNRCWRLTAEAGLQAEILLARFDALANKPPMQAEIIGRPS